MLPYVGKKVLPIYVNARKKGPRPKWTIYKHEPDKNKKCLSVNNLSGVEA